MRPNRAAITRGMFIKGAAYPAKDAPPMAVADRAIRKGAFIIGGQPLGPDPRLAPIQKQSAALAHTARQLDVARERLEALTSKLRNARADAIRAGVANLNINANISVGSVTPRADPGSNSLSTDRA